MGKKIIRKIFKPLSNSRGVALMMAIFIMTLLTFLAVEVSFRTNIENNIANQGVAKIRAYYAAKAAVELSLFRIFLYKKALAALGDSLGKNRFMLDPIWQFPFMWPPVLPDEINSVDKSMIQEAVKESPMKASYSVSIESEGGKIDINDLGSPSKELVKSTQQQIIQIFQSEVRANEALSEKYSSFNFEELVNNMIDWVDEDNVSLNGGDEKNYYRDRDPQHSDFLPPNAPFKTLKEINMVAGMNDDFFRLIANRVTVYGAKGINVNHSDKAVLRALDEQLTEEMLEKIIKRRSDPSGEGPFTDLDDFYKFLESIGVRTANFNKAKVPLTFDAELNFRIKASGQYGKVVKEIEAITFDLDNIKERYIEILTKAEKDEKGQKEEEKKQETGSTTGTAGEKTTGKASTDSAKVKLTPPKGRPKLVYWNEN